MRRLLLLGFILLCASALPVAAQEERRPVSNPAIARDEIGKAVLSLPIVSGDVRVEGLSAAVAVRRDARSMPAIEAAGFRDALFAQGFAHAQDRLFQMDLYRRLALGRLSALVGPDALGLDAFHRRLGFAGVAEAVLEKMPAERRADLDAYVAGVNAGIKTRRGLPLEHRLLGVEPEAWTARDSVAMVLFMFRALAGDFGGEHIAAAMREALPESVTRFVIPERTRFDAPMTGRNWREGDAAAIPPASDVDWRGLSSQDFGPRPGRPWPIDDVPLEDTLGAMPGSNAWAVAGERTARGGALLASDMHQPLGVPNVWHPVQMAWGGGGWSETGGERVELRSSRERGQAVGLSLPGLPGIVAGSNGAVAWGSTNLVADVLDRIVIEIDPENPGRYRTPDGWEPFETSVAAIDVRGRAPFFVMIDRTRWGAVIERDLKGRPLARAWTGTRAEAINMASLDMLFADDLDDAAEVAAHAGGPPLNTMIADDHGRIGWMVSGWIPARRGFDGSEPASWADGAGWDGPLPESRRPTLLDPDDGLVWSSNNRGGSLERFRPIGRVFAPPVRAWRVRQMLRNANGVDERDMLAMQYDVRAVAMDFFRDQLEAAFEDEPPESPRLRVIVREALAWEGDADAESAAYRYLRGFRHVLMRELVGELVEPVLAVDPGFQFWPPTDEPVRRLLEAQPAHLLPPGHADWPAYLRSAFARSARGVAEEADAFGERLGPSATWGEANRLKMQHPMSALAPSWLTTIAGGALAMLDMPRHEQSGDVHTVRVARPTFGSSSQLVVSPGAEHRGHLMMPGGISGNPFSPHYRDRHRAWASGTPEPLLAGEPVDTLLLIPD